jgi:hypothetical protein
MLTQHYHLFFISLTSNHGRSHYPDMNTILRYCAITEDGFGSYEDIIILDEKEITRLAKGFGDRTADQGRIIFGLCHTSLLKATVHWVQDSGRISREPSLDDILDAASFHAAIEIVHQRAQVRKHNAEGSDKPSKAASPMTLKWQKYWLMWSHSISKYLLTILGQD